MKHSLLLALRYTLYYRLRSAILVICLSISLFLPLAVHVLVGYYNHLMIERSESTPLVIGAQGSVYDLVLNSVYFKGRLESDLTMAEVEKIRRGGLATPVPMYTRFTADKQMIVGTTLEYFAFRKLRIKRGTLPQVLGDIVLGAAAARKLERGPGDTLPSDVEKLYDPSSEYPLEMKVVGVFEESGTPDDLVIFADVKTTWLIEGLVHGHVNVRNADPATYRVLPDGNVQMTAAVKQYTQVTPEMLDTFHFHGDRSEYPITAVIVLPHDRESAIKLKARYRLEEQTQAVVPKDVVGRMMDVVFRVKRFFDAVFLIVLVSTALFLLLVMLLSIRIRQRELQTLYKIGCSRSTVFALLAAEVLLLLAASLAVAGALLAAVMWYVVRFDVLL